LRGDADSLQHGGNAIGVSLMGSLRDLVPVHGGGIGLARKFGDRLSRGALAQHQRRANCLETFL
jgi:hypothetical protein